MEDFRDTIGITLSLGNQHRLFNDFGSLVIFPIGDINQAFQAVTVCYTCVISQLAHVRQCLMQALPGDCPVIEK